MRTERIVYDGHRTQPTIEGTKFYKFRGHYYIFSPAGGVPTGWQVVLRAEIPYGPLGLDDFPTGLKVTVETT